MSDDPLAAIRHRTQTNRFWRHLGVDVADARPGWVRLRLRVRDDLCNAPGAPLHGGVYASLVDMAIGAALATQRGAGGGAGGVDQTTLDLNVSFLAAVRDGEVFAEGRILRAGRTIAFGEATITDGGGRLLAAGRATYMILSARE
ncbi:MAG TPA: PaaI family thioesterase [Candidatus Binatia bacterium]|nr:PaaI family thioesterase [Candidatus Binatia bacterium]